VRHVSFDEMTCRERGAETELAGQHGGAHDARQLAGVLAGVGGVGAADAEEVEHAGLGFEDGAAADGADFDAGHRDRDLEIAVRAGGKGISTLKGECGCGVNDSLLHDGDAITALDILCWVLTSSQEHG
jgi:hypothetical protein